ncbi:serine hydrolase [Patescibacteria group bacterium]
MGIKNEVKELVKKLDGNIGVYVKFLNSGETIEINADLQFQAASIIKIPILTEFFRQVEEGDLKLNRKIKIKEENLVKGSGIVHLLDKNNEYTLEDLAKLAVILSDNASTNEIVDLIGPENVKKHIEKLGLEKTTFKHKMMIKANGGPNLTTPKEISILLEKLYNNELAYSEKILDIMTESKLRHGIPSLIPNEIKISHKTGNLQNTVHNVAVIYAKNPFIMSFLSNNQKDKRFTNKVMAECAKLCFAYANK